MFIQLDVNTFINIDNVMMIIPAEDEEKGAIYKIIFKNAIKIDNKEVSEIIIPRNVNYSAKIIWE